MEFDDLTVKAPNQMHQVKRDLDTGEMITKVWFEPRGMPINFPARTSLRLVAEGERPGDLEIVKRDVEIFVYAWPTSVLSVYQGSQLVRRFETAAPDVPPGHTTRSFVDMMFECQGENDDGTV